MRSHAVPLASGPSQAGALPLILASGLIAIAIVAAIWAPLYVEAFRTGTLVDDDDAMRLVQVRSWMAGQGWYDLTQTRLNPPDSPIAHWSRLVDVPIALLIRAFGLVHAPEAAERLAIVIWPTLLGAVTALSLLAFARKLFPPAIVFVGSIVVGFNVVLFFQFAPGRIDHHGVQMLLALALFAATAEAIFDRRPRAGAAAGAVAGLTLTIGLETVFFVAAAAIAFGLFWILQGERAGRSVRMFGAALAIAAPLLFALTIAPTRWTVPACDAIALPWLWLAAGGGITLAGLGLMRAPDGMIRRAVWAVAPAAVIAILFVAWWPDCLRDPYVDVDPLARELWLSGVGEARSTLDLIRDGPTTFLFFLAFPLVGWLGLAFATVREWRRRPVFLLLFAFASIGLAISLLQMRGAPLAALFGVYGCLYMVDWALQRATASPKALPLGAAVVVLAASLPFGWSALGSAFEGTGNRGERCGSPSDLAALASEPSGLVLAPVTLGPRILVATSHAVIAAPYHRNIQGNRIALEALTSSERAARRMLDEKKVSYVAICTEEEASRRLAAAGDENFADALLSGATPGWLEALPQHGSLRAWRVAGRE